MANDSSSTSPHRRRRRGWTPLLISATLLLAAFAILIGPRLIGDASEQQDLAEFYLPPTADTEGTPGSIVKIEPLQGHPFDAEAWRIMYVTTDHTGASVRATGVVVTPATDAPAGGRTILAWGHPTTGTAESCAPSRAFDPFLDVEGMRVMLDRGYTVVATDYVGMGTEGPASYLVGATAGNSVLDAIRAARSIPDAEASASVILWGHSQGGQAVLFAAERAAVYAPDLRIEAVAAAAPAADLAALLNSHLDDVSGVTIGSYAFAAYATAYTDRGAQLEQVLTPAAQEILPRMNELCLLTQLSELHRLADPVIGRFFSADPSAVEPWTSLLRENSAGAMTFDAPLFIAQGLDDTLVLPEDTAAFVEHEKHLGIDVTYQTIDFANHGTVAYLALPALNAWLDERGL